MAQPDFPYRIDGTGRTASASGAAHVRDLVEQVLFTAPGERVMRPDFGAGLAALVFEPNSSALAATVQMLAQASLQQHLGHLIAVDEVSVQAQDAVLAVRVRYTLLADGSVQVLRLVPPGGAA